MKRALIVSLCLCMVLTNSAQEKNETDTHNNIYIELVGGSSLVGVNYDARFNDHTRWGWRAGLSWTYTNRTGFIDVYSNDIRYWAVPIGINYLIGNKKKALEIGLGASVGLVNYHYTLVSSRTEDVSQADYERYSNDYSLLPNNAVLYYDDDAQKAYLVSYDYNNRSKNTFGYYFFGDIGYRHVANSGFLFRVGLSPVLNFGGKHAVSRYYGDDFHKFSIGGYIAFGWAF